MSEPAMHEGEQSNRATSARRLSRTLRTWPFNRRLISYSPLHYIFHSLCHILFLVAPVALGLLEKAIFDTISGAQPMALGLWSFIALYISVGLARLMISFGDIWGDVTFRYIVGMLLRRNLFASLLRRPGAKVMPISSGEAISRYEDDVEEVADFPLWLPDVAGHLLAFGLGVAIMASINLTITLVIFLPLAASVVLTRIAWGRILHYSRAGRQASDAVTSFLAETFASAQAITVAGAEEHVVQHFHTLNQTRRQALVKQRLFRELLSAASGGAVVFGIGVMLLLAGDAMRAGTFSVGDFALFVYYLWFTTELPAVLGTFIGDYKQQEVSIERLVELLPDEAPEVLLKHQPLQQQTDVPPPPQRDKCSQSMLEVLEVRGLSYQHPDSEQGIRAIDLTLRRGSFTVITGQVGAGKTTLLRVLLGLLPRDAGELRWNGAPIADPAAFLRPPRAAYTAQAPRLFSDSLRNNILLGLEREQADLASAVRQAILERDIATLERGMDTLVGPRGVRLSGGQLQRAAAARMFVREPELLVFDDLSSALDVETERLLWDGIFARREATCLVVSHRRAALRRADHIIVLAEGRSAAEGDLAYLLATCQELQHLWRKEDAGQESQGAAPG